MQNPTRLIRNHAFALFLCATPLFGCSNQSAAQQAEATKPAPPPSNLTPEQKQAYEQAVKSAGPPMAPPAGK